MKKDNLDNLLAQQIKKELPEAPVNPWFIRKVLNRLPAKRKSRLFISGWAFFIIIAGISAGLVFEYRQLVGADTIYVRDFMLIGLLGLSLLATSLWFLSQLFADD